MSLTSNLRIRNAASSASLPCTFNGCTRTFKSKSGLTKHIRVHGRADESAGDQAPSTSTSRRRGRPAPENGLLHCSFAECNLSFENRAGLTKHIRTFHRAHSNPPDRVPPSRLNPSTPLPSCGSATSQVTIDDDAMNLDGALTRPQALRFHF